jgi:hypothetical protein
MDNVDKPSDSEFNVNCNLTAHKDSNKFLGIYKQ